MFKIINYHRSPRANMSSRNYNIFIWSLRWNKEGWMWRGLSSFTFLWMCSLRHDEVKNNFLWLDLREGTEDKTKELKDLGKENFYLEIMEKNQKFPWENEDPGLRLQIIGILWKDLGLGEWEKGWRELGFWKRWGRRGGGGWMREKERWGHYKDRVEKLWTRRPVDRVGRPVETESTRLSVGRPLRSTGYG